MNWDVRKIVLFALLPLMAFFMSVSAQYSDCSLGYGCQPSSCQTYDMRNCWFQADLLWWKARGSNISYISNFEIATSQGLSGNVIAVKGKRKSVHFERDFGVRLGLGYRDPCSCNDAIFYWTYFNTSAHGRPDGDKCITSCFFDWVYDTDTKWRLNLNFWDFEFGKSCQVDDCLFLRGFVGARGARISQKYESESAFIDESTVLLPIVALDTFAGFDEKYIFNGGGPRIGLEGEWLIGCGMSLYGEADVSFLVGYNEKKVTNLIVNGDLEKRIQVRETLVENDECLQANRVITDLGGGIRWRPSKCVCGYPWQFQLGWEHHVIFGQKDIFFGQDLTQFEARPFPDEIPTPLFRGPCKSSLAVYGIVLSAAVEF